MQIITGEATEALRLLPSGCCSTCVTSPPYYGLRNYGEAGQIGLEETPEEYTRRLVEVFREVRRVLKDDGTLWLNIGDSYAASGKGRNRDGRFNEKAENIQSSGQRKSRIRRTCEGNGLKRKDLIGIPWLLAFALRDPTATTALSNVQRSQRGLQSKRAGEHFENLISASLNWYKDKGVAFIEKTPEPMRPLRPPNRMGQFLACYTKAGQPDFKGTLTGGRAVVFEAKHTDSDRIEYGRLTKEQIDSLTEHHRLGAAAFIMVSFELQDFYRVPWETWRDMKSIYGHKHMTQAELEPFRVEYIAGVLKLLEGVELDTPDIEQKGDRTNE